MLRRYHESTKSEKNNMLIRSYGNTEGKCFIHISISPYYRRMFSRLPFIHCLSCLFLVLVLLSCTQEKQREPSFFLVDDLGREVYFAKVPQRIISLAPSITEIISALNVGDRLVGVTSHCNYPPEAKTKFKVGDFANPNLERIAVLKPDLILLTSQGQSQLLTKLEGLKLNNFVIQAESVEKIYHSIELLGTILGKRTIADSLVQEMKQGFAQLDSLVRAENLTSPRPRVFFELSDNPLMTAGENSFIGELIHRAGGMNIATDLSQSYAVINSERVIEANPQVIIMAHPVSDKREIAERIGWSKISAIKTGRVYFNLDLDLLMRPGPRVVQGAEELFRCFYLHR
ncbi:MAG: cobalamin-binding protein [Candidatus Edwardsbacteria bacterium]